MKVANAERVEVKPSDRVCQSAGTSASFKCDVLKRFGLSRREKKVTDGQRNNIQTPPDWN